MKRGFLLLLALPLRTWAETDPEPVNFPTNTAIPADSPQIQGWASGVVSFHPGPQQLGDPDYSAPANFGTPSEALGPATASFDDPFPVVSLGDGGSITLSFGIPIANKPGFDLAVFENSFNGSFLELAFVKVSSDGVNFVGFPAASHTQTDTQVNGDDSSGSLGSLRPQDLNNLAGKYRGGQGTPFELDDLVGQEGASLLDFQNIRYVQVIDVVGSIDPTYARYDSKNRIINDPWPTPFDSSGFDLDAVAVLHTVPEPGPLSLAGAGALWLAARRRRERREAFTLVELLCVVSLVMALAGLTMAAVGQVRQRADTAQCLSNLRQLAAANFSYAGEHDGSFVPAQEPRNLMRWHGTRSGVEEKFNGGQGPLSPYLGADGRVKLCPTLRDVLTGAYSFEEGTGGYGYNAAYIGGTPASTWQPERMSNLEQPGGTVMFTDTAFPRSEGVQEYAYSEPWQQERPAGRFRGKLSPSVHFRHAGLANVVWCDGHATSEKPTVFGDTNGYGGDGKKYHIGWFGPSARNGYWRPYRSE